MCMDAAVGGAVVTSVVVTSVAVGESFVMKQNLLGDVEVLHTHQTKTPHHRDSP